MPDTIWDNTDTTGKLQFHAIDGDTSRFQQQRAFVEGEIETADDVDWYEVALVAGRTYRIGVKGDATQDGSLTDPDLTGIYDANGTAVAGASDADSGAGDNAEYVFRPATSGTYFVAVGSGGAGTGTYDLVVDDLTPDVPTENLKPGEEAIRRLGDITEQVDAEFMKGDLLALDSQDSIELWSFTLSRSRQIDFVLRRISEKTDFDLLDEEGNIIWESRAGSIGSTQQFLTEPVPAGHYYIEVKGKRLEVDDNYVLRYKTGEIDPSQLHWVYQLNDIANSEETTLSDRQVYGIGGKTETYRFTLSEEKVVTFELSGLEYDGDLVVYDEDGTVVGSSRNAGTRDETVTVTLAQSSPGRHYEAQVVMREDGIASYDLTYSLTDLEVEHFDLGDITGTFKEDVQQASGWVQNGGYEQDRYTFTLTEEREVKLDVVPALDSEDSRARYAIEGPDGSELFSDTVENDSEGFIRVLGPGEYTVKVSSLASHTEQTGYNAEISTFVPDFVALTAADDVQTAGKTSFDHPSGAHYYKIETDTAGAKFFVRASVGGVSLQLLDEEGNVLMESAGDERAFVFADPDDAKDVYYVKAVPGDGVTNFDLSYELTPGIDLGTVVQAVGGTYGFLQEGRDDGEVSYHKLTLADDGEFYVAYQDSEAACFDRIRLLDTEGNEVSYGYDLHGGAAGTHLVHASQLGAGDYYIMVEYNGRPFCDTPFNYYAGSGAVPGSSNAGISTGAFEAVQDGLSASLLPVMDVGQSYVLELSPVDGETALPNFNVHVQGDGHSLPELTTTSIAAGGIQRIQFEWPEQAENVSLFISAEHGNSFPGVIWTLTPDDYRADSSTAGEVAVGESLQGNLERDGDRDWIAVELEANRGYRVDVEAGWTAGELFRGIYDSDGDLVQNAGLTYTPTEAGMYYVEVGAIADLTGQYTLTVEEETL